MWRVAANILNKQSRTADKCGPPGWELGEVRTSPHHRKLNTLGAKELGWEGGRAWTG